MWIFQYQYHYYWTLIMIDLLSTLFKVFEHGGKSFGSGIVHLGWNVFVKSPLSDPSSDRITSEPILLSPYFNRSWSSELFYFWLKKPKLFLIWCWMNTWATWQQSTTTGSRVSCFKHKWKNDKNRNPDQWSGTIHVDTSLHRCEATFGSDM